MLHALRLALCAIVHHFPEEYTSAGKRTTEMALGWAIKGTVTRSMHGSPAADIRVRCESVSITIGRMNTENELIEGNQSDAIKN